MTSSASFFLSAPAIAPQTVCGCQHVAATISSALAPSGHDERAGQAEADWLGGVLSAGGDHRDRLAPCSASFVATYKASAADHIKHLIGS
jgi:hypothetical protein